jgi:hypothetical protein
MSDITPSIGRKVWFYPDESCIQSLAATRENSHPFDATIISVHDDGTVNLAVHDHVGHHFAKLGVTLLSPNEGDIVVGCATWTPHQAKQAQAEAAPVKKAGKKAEPEFPPQGDKVLTAADAAADLAGEPRP